MAVMYPEFLTDDYSSNNPEFIVFEALKQLSDNYSIIHSKKIKGATKFSEEVELDFIIFDGEKNITCLEVKGGDISFDGQLNKWFQNDKEMIKKPDWQATRACHAVINFLGRDGKKLNINWALCFPQSSRSDQNSKIPEVPNELIIDESNLDSIIDSINNIQRYNEIKLGRPGLKNRFEADRILTSLLSSIGFIKRLGVQTQRERNQLLKMTDNQMEALEDFEVNNRMAVMGYAGTGKTVLASEFARRLATRGQNVLFLFYNRLIANTVRRGFDRDVTINCSTFHSYAKRIIDAQDQEWWQLNKSNDSFWEDDIPLKLIELDSSQLPKFDAIIIDEAQDFKPDWFEILEGMLNDSQSRFVVFYDENQDIFGRWKGLPTWSNGFAKKVLRRNCRNTKNITNYLQTLIPSTMVPFEDSPIGEEVSIQRPKTKAASTQLIIKDLEKLLSSEVSPADILILINTPFNESSLAEVKSIGKVKFEWCGRKINNRSKHIQYSNINNFKGLEAPVVFVIDVNETEVTTNPEKLYTQASRAKNILKIYKTCL